MIIRLMFLRLWALTICNYAQHANEVVSKNKLWLIANGWEICNVSKKIWRYTHKEVVCDFKMIFLHRIMILDIVPRSNKITMCLLMHLLKEHFNTEASFLQYILYKALCHTHLMKLYLLSYCWLAHILHIHKASLETNFTKLRSTSNTIIVNTRFPNKFWLRRHTIHTSGMTKIFTLTDTKNQNLLEFWGVFAIFLNTVTLYIVAWKVNSFKRCYALLNASVQWMCLLCGQR